MLIPESTSEDVNVYLEYRHHETESHYFSVAISSVLQQIEYSPTEIQARDKPVHRDFWEQIRKRKQADNISDNENSLELNQLVSVEVEVGRHPGDVGIVYETGVRTATRMSISSYLCWSDQCT
jgi:hypothetical protein